MQADSGTIGGVRLEGDKVTAGSLSAGVLTVDATGAKVNGDLQANSGTIGGVRLSGDTVTATSVTGLSNTTWDGTTNDKSRAATEGQLSVVQGKLDVLNDEAVKYDKDDDGKENMLLCCLNMNGEIQKVDCDYDVEKVEFSLLPEETKFNVNAVNKYLTIEYA